MADDKSQNDALVGLASLLASLDARATLKPERTGRSTLYDPAYHVAMVACAMDLHGEGSSHRILAAWLKLLQFVAARPALVARVEGYARERNKLPIEAWSQMPRGYLGDDVHDGVIDLLVAHGILVKTPDALEAGSRYDLLAKSASQIRERGLFAAERQIMDRLRSVRVSKALLGAT